MKYPYHLIIIGFFAYTPILSWSSAHDHKCTDHSAIAVIDSDGDGVDDSVDKDDDNDGIPDREESFCNGIILNDIDFDGEAISTQSVEDIMLTATNGGWRTSYTLENFSLPIHLEYQPNVDYSFAIGLIPEGAQQNPMALGRMAVRRGHKS